MMYNLNSCKDVCQLHLNKIRGERDNGRGLLAQAYDQLSSSQLDISLILDQQCIFIHLRTNRKKNFKKKEKRLFSAYSLFVYQHPHFPQKDTHFWISSLGNCISSDTPRLCNYLEFPIEILTRNCQLNAIQLKTRKPQTLMKQRYLRRKQKQSRCGLFSFLSFNVLF